MITARLYRDGALVEEPFDVARVSDLLEERGTRVWLDVADPTDDDLALIAEELGLHPLEVEDVRHQDQRPKVEVYGNHFFIVLHGLWLDEDDELGNSEVHVFAGEQFLVTLRYEPAFDLATVIRRWDRQPQLTEEGAAYLLYALVDEVVDGYFAVLERMEDLVDDIEDGVFSDEADAQEVQERIFRLKRSSVRFRRLVLPLREVLDLVQEQPGFVTPALGPYYRDVADHVIRTIEFIDNIREVLTAALEAQLSQTSNRLNVIMKKLTAWAGIILVPTLIAGIYGMNFRHMPELDWLFGYPFALGLMAASAGVLYVAFKRRDWL